MCEGEPAAQLSGRLDRRAPVKRHRGGRSAGEAGQLRAPFSRADGRDLDPVLAPVDDFLESMLVHGSQRDIGGQGACSLASWWRQSSEGTIEGASTECNGAKSFTFAVKITLRAGLLHRQSTNLPQVFNSGVLDVSRIGLYALEDPMILRKRACRGTFSAPRCTRRSR